MTPRFQKQLLAVAGLILLTGCGGSSPASSVDNPVDQTPVSVSTRGPLATTPVVAPSPEAPERFAAPVPKPVAPPPDGARASLPAPPPPARVVFYPPASQACESNTERVHSLGVMASDCETARRISAGYDTRVMEVAEWPGKTLVVDGWTCQITGNSGDGGEVYGLICSKDSGTITFEWGV